MEGLTIASGVWTATVLVAVVITGIATPMLLGAYRKATIRGMSRGGDGEPIARAAPAPPGQRPPLRLVSSADTAGHTMWRAARRSLQRLQLVYALAVLGYSLTLAHAWMLAAGDGFVPTRFAMLLVTFAWPMTLVLAHLGAVGRRGWLTHLGAYLIVTVVTIGYVVAVNDAFTVFQALFFWSYANLLPSILWLVVLNHRIRAVAPLVLGMAMAGTAASFGLLTWASISDAPTRAMAVVGVALDLDTGPTIALGLAVFFVVGVGGAIIGLRAIGRAYRGKRISAQSLTLDCLVLLFAVWQPVTLVSVDLRYALAGPLGFVVYLAVRALALRLLRIRAVTDTHRVLLLRVFALDAASRALFALWSPSWLRLGSIAMISGPDLATSAVEPHEFLAFLGGQLDREFVNTREQVAPRLRGYDHAPDPDGNHRANDYFCRNHTWRAVVQGLAGDADRVVMDLRGFGPGNDGCEWELGELLERVDLDKVVLLVDRNTDRAHLASTLERCWQSVSADSPNVTGDEATLRALEVHRLDASTARRILAALGN